MEIKSDFELMQKVKILPLGDKIGNVEGLFFGLGGIKYYVRYYADYDEKVNYFFADDLCPI